MKSWSQKCMAPALIQNKEEEETDDNTGNKLNKTASVFLKNKKNNEEEVIKKPLPSFQKISNSTMYREIRIPEDYAYHEVIPNFNRLFPHCCSGSMISDLRAIEEQLRDHINKNITKLSRSDEYLRVREQELIFKVISEC